MLLINQGLICHSFLDCDARCFVASACEDDERPRFAHAEAHFLCETDHFALYIAFWSLKLNIN